MIARWPSSSRKSHGASGQSSGQHPNTRHPRAPDPAPAFRTQPAPGGTERAARPRPGLGPRRHRHSPHEAIDIVYTPAQEEHSPPPFAQNDRGGPPRVGQNVHHARGRKEPPTRGQNERPARATDPAPAFRTRGPGPRRHRYSPQEAIDIVYTPLRKNTAHRPSPETIEAARPGWDRTRTAPGQKEPPTRGQNERPARAPGWAPPRTRCREPVECGARHPDTRTPPRPGNRPRELVLAGLGSPDTPPREPAPGARVGGAGVPGHPRAPGTGGTRDPRNTARPGAVETRIRRKARP